MTKPHWLEVSESVALAGSVLGTIAAAGTQQIIYATAPLTLTVALNIANRQRFKQSNQAHHQQAIASVDKAIHPLDRRLQQLESNAQHRSWETEEQISQLQKSLREDMDVAIAQVKEAIAALPDVPNLEPVTASLTTLESQMQQVGEDSERRMQELKDAFRQENEAAIAQIHDALQAIPPIPNFKPFADRLVQLEGLTQQVNRQTETRLEEFTTSLRQETETAIANIQESIAGLSHVDAIAQRLDRLEAQWQSMPSTGDETVDRSAFATAREELQQAIAAIPKLPNLDAIYERLDRLEGLSQPVNPPTEEQLERLKASLEDGDRTAIARLDEAIAAIAQRLDRLESDGTHSDRDRQVPIDAPLPPLQSKSPPPTAETGDPDPEPPSPPPENPSAPPEVPNRYRTERLNLQPPPPSPAPAASSQPFEAEADEWDEWDEEFTEEESDELKEPAVFEPEDTQEWEEEISEDIQDGEKEIENAPKFSLKQLQQPESLGRVIGNLESSIGGVVGDLQGFVGKLRQKNPPEKVSVTPVGDNVAGENWRCVRTISAHQEAINCVTIHPDDRTIAAGDRDNTVKLWQLETGAEIRTLNGEDWFASVNAVAISPDGDRIATAIGDAISIWEFSTGQPLHRLSGHSEAVYALKFHPNGQQLVSADGNGSIKIWQVENGTEIRSWKAHERRIYALAVSPDGKQIASGSADSTMKLWQWQTGDRICTLKGHGDAVKAVAISPDGKAIASGSVDGTVKIWQIERGQEILTLGGHSGGINAIAFNSPNTFASASEDKTIQLWQLETGSLIATLKRHSNAVNAIAFTRDGKTLVSGSEDKTVKVWQVG